MITSEQIENEVRKLVSESGLASVNVIKALITLYEQLKAVEVVNLPNPSPAPKVITNFDSNVEEPIPNLQTQE